MSDNQNGMFGVLKVLASVAVLAGAVLSVLVVFDLVPAETFKNLSMKILLTTAIVGAASGVISLLVGPKS